MAWAIEFHPDAVRDLRKLDRTVAKRIRDYLAERVATRRNPRELGAALAGPLKRFWKYRVGDYRVVCDIQDEKIVILIVRVGHRSGVYDE